MFRILTISALFLCIAFSTQVQAQDEYPPTQESIDLAKDEISDLKTDLLNLYTDNEIVRRMYISWSVHLDFAFDDLGGPNPDIAGAIAWMEFSKVRSIRQYLSEFLQQMRKS